jgi:hypothetical protein
LGITAASLYGSSYRVCWTGGRQGTQVCW